MHEGMLDKAREVGRLLGQTEEYRALKRARERLSDDRETVERVNRLAQLEAEIAGALRSGEAPSEETQQEYERVFSELQSGSVYQGLVAAQSNFDRIVQRVNEEMSRGMEAGASSGIILPS